MMYGEIKDRVARIVTCLSVGAPVAANAQAFREAQSLLDDLTGDRAWEADRVEDDGEVEVADGIAMEFGSLSGLLGEIRDSGASSVEVVIRFAEDGPSLAGEAAA